MPVSIPALVNPALLGWARAESGLSPELVARRVKVKVEKLLAWERAGEARPTVRQAKALAKLYHRPFGVLFLPQPPSIPPLAAEYRRLPGVQPGHESPELRLAVRVMSRRREIALELREELGVDDSRFDFSAHMAAGADALGQRLRQWLGVSNEEQMAWTDDWQAWRRWREAAETAGTLVFQFPKVPLDQVRGLSLLLFPLPVVGINSKESAPGARVFTLIHELVHIALANGREEQTALHETRRGRAWTEVERFAEEAASATLIPGELLSSLVARLDVDKNQWTLQQVRSLAGKFHVTPLAMATRLRAAGAMTWEAYRSWKDQWNRHLASRPAGKKGFATPVGKTLGRGGRPFVRLVIEALDANRITAVDACHYLDLRFDHFEKLRDELRIGNRSAARDMDDGD